MQFEGERIRRIEQNRRDYAIWDGRGAGFDPSIPRASNVSAAASGASGLNTVIVTWDDSLNPLVEEYEVFVKVADNQPERLSAVPRSPSRITYVSTAGAGTGSIIVRTVLRSGIKLSLDYSPAAPFSFV